MVCTYGLPLPQHFQQLNSSRAVGHTRRSPRTQYLCLARQKRSLEADLSELQRLSKRRAVGQRAPSGQQQRASRNSQQDPTARLVRDVSSKMGGMTVGQLCRLCFILTQLPQPQAATKPTWQAAMRRIFLHASTTSCRQHSGSSQHTRIPPESNSSSTDTSSDRAPVNRCTGIACEVSQSLFVLLQSHAGPGDVLYLLRAVAAWQDEIEGVSSSLPGDAPPSVLSIITAVAAAASSKAGDMTLQELMLSVAALAQLSFYDRHLMTAASTAFVQAVAAIQDETGSSSSSSSSSSSAANADDSSAATFAGKDTSTSSSSGSSRKQSRNSSAGTYSRQAEQQQQQQGVELLPRIRDHQLIVNFLWANASLGHADSLLLRAALQLLLQRGLVPTNISRSHLPLCMWALAALLVCLLHNQQQQQHQLGQPQYARECQMGEEVQQLVAAVAAVHSMLAQQALQLWHENSHISSSSGQDGQEQPQLAVSKVQPSSSSSSSSSNHKAKAGGHGSSSKEALRPAFSIDSRRQMYQAHVWLQAAVTASSSDGSTAELVPSRPGPTSTVSSSTGSAGHLWPLSRLLQAAEQQRRQHTCQQQQQQQGQQELSAFWEWCGVAWAGNTPHVSGLQRNVHQALQSAGLEPLLEFPAQPLSGLQQLNSQTLRALLLQQQQQQQQHSAGAPAASHYAASTVDTAVQEQPMQGASRLETAEGSGSNAASSAPTAVESEGMVSAGVAGPVAGFLSIDIACAVPQHMVRLMQQQGFRSAVTTLQQQQQHGYDCAPQDTATATAAAAAAMAAGGRTVSAAKCDADSSWSSGELQCNADCGVVAVAVEVDGPTHVVVNCVSHMLGATVCRNWLLQQWGWTVVVLPWWEWQAD